MSHSFDKSRVSYESSIGDTSNRPNRRSSNRSSGEHSNRNVHQAEGRGTKEDLIVVDPKTKIIRASRRDNSKIGKNTKNVFYDHWSIFLQGLFLVIFVIAIGPYVGQRYLDEIVRFCGGNPVTASLGLQKASGLEEMMIQRPACCYRTCFARKAEENVRLRRANFLKRKRI